MVLLWDNYVEFYFDIIYWANWKLYFYPFPGIMIPISEAAMMLNISMPWFHRWKNKLEIKTIIQKSTHWKRGYIEQNDFEKIQKAMWIKEVEQRSASVSKNSKESKNLEEEKELEKLKKENSILAIRVEESQWHLKLYEEQLSIRQQEVMTLREERKDVYRSLLNSQMILERYRVMFYAVLVVVATIVIVLGLMLRFDLIIWG